MKMISKGHYQTTITLGYNNNIVVDVVKIIGNPSESRWRLTFNETLVGNKKNYYYPCKSDAVKRAYEVAMDKVLANGINIINSSFPEFKKNNQ